MDGKIVVVETGLDEEVEWRGKSYSRKARTRFVDRPKPARPRPPMLGDPWCPLTVRARLERMAEVFRQVPHDPDTRPARHRSCMPDPVREIFKNTPGEPMRLPVAKHDLEAARMVLDSLISLHRLWRIVAWSIAARVPDTKLGKYLRKDRRTAATLKQKLLARLTSEWPGAPDVIDVSAARDFIHKKFD